MTAEDTSLEENFAHDRALTARVCWHYFKEGETQDSIAKRLNITRKRVNRILGDARASGFVRISFAGDGAIRGDLENELARKFSLRRVVVVPSPISGGDPRPMVGAAAGRYVSENLPVSGSLGISWGGTIHAAAQNLVPRTRGGERVVLLCGGLAESTNVNPYDNAASFARALNATCYYVTAPMFAPSPEFRQMMAGSEPTRSILAMARDLDLALLSAIDLSSGSKALQYGVIDEAARQSLLSIGAVGDVCGHYLDATGSPVSHPLAICAISPQLEDLRRARQLVLAAGGVQKEAIVLAAIRAGLCHVLITDERLAEKLSGN